MVYWQKGNTSQFQVKYTDYPASMMPSVKEKGLPSIVTGFQDQLPLTWPLRSQSSPTVWEGSLRLEKLSKHSTVVLSTHSSLSVYRSVWEKEKPVRDEESQHCFPDKNVPREDSQVGLDVKSGHVYKSLHVAVTPAESHALQVGGCVGSGLGREAAGAPKMKLWSASISQYSFPSLGGMRKCAKRSFM